MPAAKPSFPRLRRGHPLTVGLAGAWACYEGSGLKLNDLSGLGVQGVFATGATWAAGQNGWAVKFDGVAGHVTLGATADLNTQIPITIAAWVQPTTVGVQNAILSHATSGAFYVRVNTSNNLDYLRAGVQDIVSGSVAFAAGDWHHIAVTNDAAGNITLYVDGAADGTSAGNTTWTAPTAAATLGQDPGAGELFTGLIDAVLVYSRALSAAEIAVLAADSFAIYRRGRTPIKKAATFTGDDDSFLSYPVYSW